LAKLLPGLAAALRADVADPDSVKRAFAELDALWGGLDILVNNAGISIRHRFLDITPEEWRRVIDVNLNGMFYVAQQAARRMLEAGGGVILNMASTNGLMGYPFYADYNASKAGVIALTRSMALELAPKVRVVAVCPGFILTPMQEAEYTPEMLREFEGKVPLRRVGRPEEVAALFAYLSPGFSQTWGRGWRCSIWTRRRAARQRPRVAPPRASSPATSPPPRPAGARSSR